MSSIALAQSTSVTSAAVTSLARLAGLAVFAAILAALVALCYRWYVREQVPSGLALLVSLAGVAVVLNTTTLLAAEIATDGSSVALLDALFNIAAFVGSAGGAYAGSRFGDGLGIDLFAATGASAVDGDVREIVQTVGRVITVRLPDEIDDVVGYDPVPAATKEKLSGKRFLFPRGLTTVELRERLVSRLKTDYGVGHVDVELADDATVEYLAVGSRAAGIGPTLPPATNAVAIRADPAHAASAGDLVQVWETNPFRRVLTGELRGVAGDVVTVAIDAADTPKLNPTKRYKLVTLPVEDRPDREFASLLRAADETLATITVGPGSDLDGVAVTDLDATVAVITREDESPDPLPTGDRALQAGDVVFAIGTPDVLRRVESAAVTPEGDGAEPPAAVDIGDDDDLDDRTDTQDRETAGGEDDVPAAPDERADGDEPSGGDERPGDDQSSGDDERSSGDESAGGGAFPDPDDLPGLDPEEAVPTMPGEDGESGEATAGTDASDETPATDADEEGDDTGERTEASESDDSDASDETGMDPLEDIGVDEPPETGVELTETDEFDVETDDFGDDVEDDDDDLLSDLSGDDADDLSAVMEEEDPADVPSTDDDADGGGDTGDDADSDDGREQTEDNGLADGDGDRERES